MRAPSTTDRRAVLVSLTDHGRSIAADGAARFDADVALLFQRLPPADRAALSRLISRLLAAHAADRAIEPPATAPGT